jgi:7-alpha-hydroxysteroid dehydrogenase
MTIQDRFRLDGQVAVVALAEAGADVLLSSRTEEQLQEVASKVEAAGRKAHVLPADLSDLEAVAGLADAAVAAFGRLDIVVNNVGGTMPRPFMDTSPRRLVEAFSWNVATAHALTKAAVPHMLEQGGGAVVGISSMMGRTSGRGYVAYGTAKAGLSHWTRLAAQDLAPKIRVNAIAVGSIATSALDIVLQDDDLRTAMESGTPLRRIGHPDEIAATVLFLASAAGGYVTGKVFEVDGGIEQPNLDMGLPDL